MSEKTITINKICFCCNSKDILCCMELDSKHLLHCMDCGVYFFAEPPTDHELDSHYKTNYSKVHQKQLFELLKKNYDSGFYRSEVTNILNYYGKENANGLQILDYGSGYGFFLKAAKEKGFTPYGVEYDEVVAKYNEDEFGINMIKNSEFETLQDESFDIIRSNHCIEHLPDPHRILSLFFKKLKKNGIITISSPCFSKHIVQSNTMKLYDMVYPEHLIYFTSNSMQKLLENTGFKVELNMTQFAASEQALRLLEINHDSDRLCNTLNFKDFQRSMELDPFLAGVNLFAVGRKKVNETFVQKLEPRDTSLILDIHALNEYEITIYDNSSGNSIIKNGKKNFNTRVVYFDLSEDSSNWKILFPFKSNNYKNGKIYLSGIIHTINSYNTIITILDKNKKPLSDNTGTIRFNDIHNFQIISQYSGNGNPEIFYVLLLERE